MAGFVTGADRTQGTMFPAQLEDYVAADNPVRVIDFADFRKDNGPAIRKVCREFAVVCGSVDCCLKGY